MERSAKRSKPDDGVLVLDKLKGRIVLHIEGISEIIKEKQDCRSKSVRIRGFDWILYRPSSSPNNGREFYIKCDGGSRGPGWHCVASIIILCNSGDEEIEIGRADDLKFDETSNGVCKVSIKQISVTILIILTINFLNQCYLGKQ